MALSVNTLEAPIQTLVLSEDDLRRYSGCPLYRSKKPDLMETAAMKTFRWAVNQSYSKFNLTAKDLREHFVREWNSAWGDKERDSAFWEGPETSIRFGRVMYEFFNKYEVSQPYEPYSLELPAGTIEGERAVLLWHKTRLDPEYLLLDARIYRPKYYLPPNYPALAQWLSGYDEGDFTNTDILHFPSYRSHLENLCQGYRHSFISQVAQCHRRTKGTGPWLPHSGKPVCDLYPSLRGSHTWTNRASLGLSRPGSSSTSHEAVCPD
jgi:hypothetical protein